MQSTGVILTAIKAAAAGNMEVANKLLDNDEFWVKHEAAMREKEEAALQAKRAEFEQVRKRRWEAIPREYRELFDPKKASISQDTVSFCRKWRPERGKGIGLIGDSGSGKTRLLVAILRNLRDPWLFLPATKFAESVRRQYDDDFGIADRAYRTLRDARHVRVLLLDDLGMENATASVTEELAGLIEHRVHRRLPILWSSNRTAIELAEHYGSRGKAIVRRLAEFSWTP